MVNFIRQETDIAAKPLQAANQAIVVGKDTLKDYNKSHVNVLKGREVESLIFQLVKLLEVKHVYLATPGSMLDCCYKTDIVITRNDRTVVPMQIKASKAGAEEYLRKYPFITVDGKSYPSPSVVYMEVGDKPIEVLFALKDFLCVEFKGWLIEAVNTLKTVKGNGTAKRTMELSALSLTEQQVEALKLLGLCSTSTRGISRTTITF